MAIQLKTEDARSIAGTALTGTLADVGAVTANPARIVQIFNSCDDVVVVSWDDGVTDGFILPASSATSIDCSINDEPDEVRPKLPAGAQFQAKHNGAGPSSGLISIMVIY